MKGVLVFLLLMASFLCLLRFLAELHRINFYNPLVQTLARWTDPVVRPLGRIVPTIGDWNGAVLVILLLLQMAIFWGQGFVGSNQALVAVSAIKLVSRVLDIYIMSLIVVVIASWIQFTGAGQWLLSLAQDLSRPLLTRVRALLPSSGMLDFSPMVSVIAIIIVQHFVLQAQVAVESL